MNKKHTLLALTAVAAGTAIYNIWKPIKSDLPVIRDFVLEKYLGKWHEIARLDFFWEKNLKNVTATYSTLPKGAVKVDNQGIDIKSGKHKQSIGKAKMIGAAEIGALKVSFFGPFYSGYNIMHIDENYQYALVFGENLDYMWILSRDKNVPDDIKKKYLDYAQKSGYDIERLIWTIQE